jgi:hypothetical protein
MESRQAFRVVAAGTIGNVLEWYDFAIYGYFATAIGRQFFPHEDPVASCFLRSSTARGIGTDCRR